MNYHNCKIFLFSLFLFILSATFQTNTIYAQKLPVTTNKQHLKTTWVSLLTGQKVYSLAIDPSNPDTIYAGTANGILKSIDKGFNWTFLPTQPPLKRIDTLVVAPKNNKLLYAGMTTKTGKIFESLDGGESWKNITSFPPFANSIAFAPQNPAIFYIGTTTNIVFRNHKSTSGSVTSIDSNKKIKALVVDPLNSEILYAIMKKSGLFKSIDGGKTWDTFKYPLMDKYISSLVLNPIHPNIIYAGVARKGVHVSLNGGQSWNTLSNSLGNIYVNALAIDPSCKTLYAGTTNGIFSIGLNDSITPMDACTSIPLKPTQSIDGSLTQDDCLSGDNIIDLYNINGVAGQQLNVMITATFDPRILIIRTNGVTLLDFHGSANELRTSAFTPSTTEPLTIVVTSRFTRRIGNYTLRYVEPNCSGITLNSGQAVNDMLSIDDCLIDIEGNDRFADRYSVNGVDGQQLNVMITATFDPLLNIRRTNGIVLFSFRGSSNEFSRVVFTPSTTEPLIIEVTSRFARRIGNYNFTFVNGQDFTLSFNPSQVTLARGSKGVFTVNINRIGGFTGNVTIIPPNTSAVKIKLTPSSSQSSTGSTVNFSYKVKKNSPLGVQPLTFMGSDSSGKVRTATLMVTIQ